jgi:hypothetical protein
VAGFCKHGNEPSGSIKKASCYLIGRVTISFSKNILYHGVSMYTHLDKTSNTVNTSYINMYKYTQRTI